MSENSRYQRQIILSEIGLEGQEKMANTSVLCVGAGGLGSPALLYLAAAGIGRIGIADFDQVDESNLQRQILFTTDQTGTLKTESAQKKLKALNPNITVAVYPEGLTADNVEALFADHDIIIDGTDNFEAKFLINDAGVKFSKPVIYAAIQKFEAQVSVFDATQGPCYRCLYPAPPEGHVQNCAEAGIVGAVAGITGTTQAMQAIMLAVPHKSFSPLIGKLWTIDTRTMETHILEIPKNPACPVCSKKKEDIVIRHTPSVCCAIAEVTPNQIKKNHTDALLIDVREQDEWNAGHIEGGQHMALSALVEGNIPDLPGDQAIILYCQKGMRSKKAAQLLQAEGYANVCSLAGGYEAWLKSA